MSIFYLIPQMVGAGVLVQPLLGLPHWAGVVLVGAVVIFIVVTAGMVSTTWVQFIKGSLLVVFSTVLTVLILNRGFHADHESPSSRKPSSSSADGQVLVNGLPRGNGPGEGQLRARRQHQPPAGRTSKRPARSGRSNSSACCEQSEVVL